MAGGTVIRKNGAVRAETEQLPSQAIIRDRDAFFDETHRMAERTLERK